MCVCGRFINMTPQIFINYKLKSVAHMPWRVLAYKAFNTFIDDVFAFVLMKEHMSAKHRWMVPTHTHLTPHTSHTHTHTHAHGTA